MMWLVSAVGVCGGVGLCAAMAWGLDAVGGLLFQARELSGVVLTTSLDAAIVRYGQRISPIP